MFTLRFAQSSSSLFQAFREMGESVMAERNDPANIEGYPAHIYYDEGSREPAAHMREQLEQNFTVEMGRWRDQPVGPHPISMYQVKFAPNEFQRIVPWLMLNRAELTVLVHPEPGEAYADHAHHALGLGPKVQLRLDILRISAHPAGQPAPPAPEPSNKTA